MQFNFPANITGAGKKNFMRKTSIKIKILFKERFLKLNSKFFKISFQDYIIIKIRKITEYIHHVYKIFNSTLNQNCKLKKFS